MPIQADDARLADDYWPSPSGYSDFGYARTGLSAILLPRISLGLWHNFGHDRPAETQRAIIRHAFDRGITHFDLANSYGPPYGQAERTFWRSLLKDLRPYRDELFLWTKAGYDMWPGPYGDGGSRKYLITSVDQSLRRLGTDYVDVFYHHRPDADTQLEETAGALASIVSSGKGLYVGLSNYPPDLTRRATELLADDGIRPLLHQPRHSLFDRRSEGSVFPTVKELGIGVAIEGSRLAIGVEWISALEEFAAPLGSTV